MKIVSTIINSIKYVYNGVIGLFAVIIYIVLPCLFIYFAFISPHFNKYEPTPEITKIVQKLKLTEHGREILFSSYPTLVDNKAKLSSLCNVTVDSIGGGCHKKNKIYAYKNEDLRFQGQTEYIIAHEILHAAYDGLEYNEKLRINELLNNFRSNKKLMERMKPYKELEDREFINELHSVVGSEVITLPSRLEQYYHRYFQDRRIVLALHESSKRAQTEKENQITAYDEELQNQEKLISSLKKKFNEQNQVLIKKKDKMKVFLQQKNYVKYNQIVKTYNLEIPKLQELEKTLNKSIDQYNKTVSKKNLTVQEIKELLEFTKIPKSEHLKTKRNIKSDLK